MKCPKCNGFLIPDRDLSGLTQSIGCINCGNRVFRGVAVRTPSAAERNGLAGIVKTHKGRLAHA